MRLRVSWSNMCALSMLLSLCGCGGGEHATANVNNPPVVTIIPGVSLDEVAIGELLAEVTARYGTPDTASSQLGYVMVGWEKQGITVGGFDGNLNGVFDADEVCQGLAAATPYAGKTEKGIGVGSTREAVRNAYGIPEDNAATNDKYLALGIGFLYRDDAADAPVAQVAIFPAGSTVPTASSILEGK